MVSAVAVLFVLLVIVEAVLYVRARVEKAQAAMEHLSITERTLTLDEYRTERFEPFPFALWHWQVLDDTFPATHEIGHVLVLDLTGRLVGAEASAAFSGRIRELFEQGERTIVVNLKGLTRVDSMGLAGLARSTVTVSRAGGTIVYVNAPRHFCQLMAIIKSNSGERVSVGPSTGGPRT